MKTFAEVFIDEISSLGQALLIEGDHPEDVQRFWKLSIAVHRHYQAWFKVKHRDYVYPHTVTDRWDGPEAL